MRLYNTLSRQLEELPAPPGPIRMYFCGPTVYQRAHIGNARPFVLGMWLRNWLRMRGYEATLVHNITDVNDKIYDAAPGASAQLAAQATEWYLKDTGDLGLGDGRSCVRAGLRDPRRRARPRLSASRERARTVARARPRVRAPLDAQRHAGVRGREDVEVARERCVASQRARHLGEGSRA